MKSHSPRRICTLLAIGLLISLVAPLSAQTLKTQKTIFVDSMYGSDSTGMVERSDYPVQTLAGALALASAGYTIEMRPGTYSYSGSVTILFPVTIKGHGAVITSPLPNSDQNKIAIEANGVKIYGLEIDSSGSSGERLDTGAITVYNASDVTIQDCYIHDVISRCVCTYGTSERLRIEGCRFVNFFNAIEGYTSPNDCQIINSYFKSVYSDAQYSGAIKLSFAEGGGHGYNVSGNTIYDAGEMGIEIWGGQDLARVTNNYVNGTVFGISLNNTNNSIVANNIVKGATWIGIEMALGSHNQFLGNVVDGFVGSTPTTSQGFLISGENSNHFRLSNNRITGCENSIHAINATYGTITENDVIMDSSIYFGINIQDCQQMDISNNTIDVSGLSDAPLWIDNGGGGVLEHFRIHGNNFIVANGNTWNIAVFNFVTGGTTRDVDLTNNSFTNMAGYSIGYINSKVINKLGTGTLEFRRVSGNIPSVSTTQPYSGFYNVDDGDIQGPIASEGYPVPVQVPVPASASASGSVGQTAYDASYVYICVAPNTWKRSAIATW